MTAADARPTTHTPSPGRRTFEERLSELEEYVDAHGRLPDATPGGLGKWLTNQRFRTTEQNRIALDQRVPGWEMRRSRRRPRGLVTEAFLARVADLEDYVAEHGDIPGRNPPSALRHWIERKRKYGSPDQRAVLDDRVPGWAATKFTKASVEQRIEQVRVFVAEHGRVPKQQDGGLGDWVRHQRRITPPGEPHPLDVIDPSWRQGGSPKSRVDDRIAELQEIRSRTGAFPRFSDGPLGRWFADQRRRATPENAAKLDAALPGWRETGRRS